MTNIYVLPGSRNVRRLRLPKRRIYDVRIKIIDSHHPKRTRWVAQFSINRACGFKGNRGFTDASVSAGRWHRIEVGGNLLSRFVVRDLGALVAEGLIRVRIEGKELEAKEAA